MALLKAAAPALGLLAVQAALAADPVGVMVPDIQLNDLTDLPNAPQELARVEYLSSTFRQKLAANGVVVLPASEPLQKAIAENSATYLFDRPAEAAELAKPSGAEYVIIGVALKPTYLFVYPRLLLVDVKTGAVVFPTYAQLESSWSDQNTTRRTGEFLADKISGKLKEIAAAK